jgi:hypothetical protein
VSATDWLGGLRRLQSGQAECLYPVAVGYSGKGGVLTSRKVEVCRLLVVDVDNKSEGLTMILTHDAAQAVVTHKVQERSLWVSK